MHNTMYTSFCKMLKLCSCWPAAIVKPHFTVLIKCDDWHEVECLSEHINTHGNIVMLVATAGPHTASHDCANLTLKPCVLMMCIPDPKTMCSDDVHE